MCSFSRAEKSQSNFWKSQDYIEKRKHCSFMNIKEHSANNNGKRSIDSTPTNLHVLMCSCLFFAYLQGSTLLWCLEHLDAINISIYLHPQRREKLSHWTILILTGICIISPKQLLNKFNAESLSSLTFLCWQYCGTSLFTSRRQIMEPSSVYLTEGHCHLLAGLHLPSHSVLSGHPSPPAFTAKPQEGVRSEWSLLLAGRDSCPLEAQLGQRSPQIFSLLIGKLKSNQRAWVKIGLKSSPDSWKPQTLRQPHFPSVQGNRSIAFCLYRFGDYRYIIYMT